MREIIFRGKRIDNGKWVYGDLAHFPDKINIDPHKHGQPWRGYAVIPETVGQYTGLTDKNGKKIFEGDYWIDTDDDYCVFVVEFREGQFCFVLYGWRGALMEYGYDETAGGFGECDCTPMTDYNIDLIEIEGNIHDNPELIKEV
jgi:uncharacterized phage protein (TIGR01671 family)